MALYSIETYGELDPHVRQEWLLTNGLGAYAASTVVGCNTRRYHGLLCAATLPPVGRIMTLNRIGEILEFTDPPSAQPLEFSCNQFKEAFHPHGDRYLRRFDLDATARWTYEIESILVIKELQLLWGRNAIGLRYAVNAPAGRKWKLSLLPFVSMRDFHSEQHGTDRQFGIMSSGPSAAIAAEHQTLHMLADGAATFVRQPDWWYGQYYAIENERGQDDTEDLFNPGRFVLEGIGPWSTTIWAALDPIAGLDWDKELARRSSAIAAAAKPAEYAGVASLTMRRLVRAANDFIIARKKPDGSPGTSVIAGYPWFADWGRDTMISLPGLLVHTRRFEQARQVLTVFASYVSEGMIPNRFDDYTNEPSYNTVDASLWFIHAVHEYVKASGDRQTFDRILRPACAAIIAGYRQGTRFFIKMDEADGLISQGDPQTQLTWMDAKYNGVCFTPRQGKPVEINALWYHALILMGEGKLAEKVAESFRAKYWLNPFRGLCDVVNDPGRDTSLRPNQIFAVSLPNSPLLPEQQSAVVEVVRRELLTPYGIRTLARTEPGYHGRYAGPQSQRDAAYHNGTVWPWLIGPFLSAFLRVNNHSEESKTQARRWLTPLIEQTESAGIGQIAEIYEGDEPHRPVGCPAQAWSVAEVLRIADELGM
ncbi:MAG TPA: amylo-alpha-1,6-glucosidase [Tepidisphaeraceae bacterium]|jgi:predicted glycogen debranching enzyme|nr:amylo-alpha-1,6-glucosidase [Tepidisphaeraceae bacterium]